MPEPKKPEERKEPPAKGAPAEKAPAAAPAAAAPTAAAPPTKERLKAPKHLRGSAKAARRKARKRKGAIQARRKREFTYRGYTLDELRSMSLAELVDLFPARARRSFQRGLNDEQQAFVDRLRASTEPLKTHRREIVILPEFVGKSVLIHNGRAFSRLDIKPEMIGHYLGEFAMTRLPVKHSGPGVGATRSSKFMPLK